jgi:streptomycin 6-kinase
LGDYLKNMKVIKLNNYLTAWNLSNPQLLMQRMTSHIYTVTYETETVILKLLSPSEIDEQRGAVALRCFDGHGAVRLLHYDEGAQLMELAFTYAYACLNASWWLLRIGTKGAEDIVRWRLNVAVIIEPHVDR